MKKALRIARTVIAIGAALSLTAVVAADLAVERIGHGRLCDRPEEVPAGRAALVLGTSQLLRDGSPNPYFDNRIRAAVLLWRTGRITAIVVSGDNGRTTYNEPEAMRDALVTQGVPAEAIRLDHAGFRTLDDVRTGGMIRVWLRERLARVKLFLDLAFGKEPKFLGERIELKPYGHE